MIRSLAILSAAAFIAIAVFGFLPMHDGNGHTSGCIASAAAATPCPAETGTIGFLNFHANAFHAFSNAIPLAATALLFALLILALFRDAAPGRDRFSPLRAIPFARQTPSAPLFPLPARVARWLSLHENSPSFR